MPVGKPTDDGEIVQGSRHYSGKPNPLGQIAQWTCVSCGMAVEAAPHPIEQGCPHCGAGVPGVKSSAAPVVSSPPEDGVGPRESKNPRPPATERANQGRPVEPTDQGLVTVYRIIRYEGTREWLTTTLRRSLVGGQSMGMGASITATIVDDVSTRQQDLLGMAMRQPGVWLSQEGIPERREAGPPVFIRKVPAVRYEQARTSPVPLEKEIRSMAETPNTGPVPTGQERDIASAVYRHVEDRGAYTLAMALNQFSTVVEDETMERDKYWSPQQCLGVATALLALIPKDWDPEPEVEEQPPAPPTAPEVL